MQPFYCRLRSPLHTLVAVLVLGTVVSAAENASPSDPDVGLLLKSIVVPTGLDESVSLATIFKYVTIAILPLLLAVLGCVLWRSRSLARVVRRRTKDFQESKRQRELDHTPSTIDSQVAKHRQGGSTAPRKTIPAGCRILFAEGGSANQQLIALLLIQAGVQVEVVENGAVAVEVALVADKPYDVILMDMQMPLMDGYEATNQLRQAGYKGPIVALTAHATSEDEQKCFEAGCDAYLAKPIDRATLLETVARLVDREAAEGTEAGLSCTASGS